MKKENLIIIIFGNIVAMWVMGLVFAPMLLNISRLAYFGWSWASLIAAFLVWMFWRIGQKDDHPKYPYTDTIGDQMWD